MVDLVRQTIRNMLFALVMYVVQGIPAYASDYEFQASGNIAVVGDINGGYEELVSLLQEVSIIDASLNWIAGDTHFISLGNLLASGLPASDLPASRGRGTELISLLRKLETQASERGGKVHIVLGDSDIGVLTSSDTLTNGARNWLLEHPVIIKINNVVYTHGGIASDFVEDSLVSINTTATKELATIVSSSSNKYQQLSLFSDRNPVRYEGTAICHPYSESFNTERFLKNVKATRIVVGHVATNGQVMSRMGGLVVMLDTGMSEGGAASILVTPPGGDPYVHYLGSDRKSPIVPEWNQLSMRISGLSDIEVEDLLAQSPVISVAEIGTGITNPRRIEQLRDGVEHSALFKYVDTDPGLQSRKYYNRRKNDEGDRYVYEVAAYKLDRMLDIQLVPVTVLGTVKDKEGILQDWITNAINERDRLEDDVEFDGPCRQLEQYRLRIVFDILIYNEDRNLTNIMWAKENFKMRFIDHTRAFRSSTRRPEQYKKVKIRVSDFFRKKLESLTIGSLTDELGDYLHPLQIKSLLARRDLILKATESTGTW